jgi:hypothetical protein
MDARLTQMMMADAEKVQKQYDSQQMTEKQKDNWMLLAPANWILK